MIIKCSSCQEPMTDSKEGRPDGLDQKIRWVTCKQCGNGIEVLGEESQTTKPSQSNVMDYEETIYVRIEKTETQVIKSSYSDQERTKLIHQEVLG